MLRLLSDLIEASRLDIPAADDVSLSGYQGTWVTLDGNNEATICTGVEALAYPIWTEGNRDGSQGFTPDVATTDKITVLKGRFEAQTDQYSGSITEVGQRLTTGANGKLIAATDDAKAGEVVAVVTKIPFSLSYLGSDFTVIQFETI